MVRPIKPRFVRELPLVFYFKPRGIPLSTLDEIVLKIEELEAIKLKDLEGLDQEECAKKMKISRGTFQRVLNSAKKKIADALVNGKAIRLEGGNYKIQSRTRMIARGFRRRASRPGGGPPKLCVCPACGNQQPKLLAIPCSQMKCNKCGSLMLRGD